MSGFVYPGAAFQIHGFHPPAGDHGGMGRWGVGVDLDARFAKLALDTPMTDETTMRLHEIGERIVVGFFPKAPKLFGGYYGYATDGTWLIRGLSVPGNCACLFATEDRDDLKRDGVAAFDAGPFVGAIRYTPHNVDTQVQASCMLALWLRWYNAATASLLQPNKVG